MSSVRCLLVLLLRLRCTAGVAPVSFFIFKTLFHVFILSLSLFYSLWHSFTCAFFFHLFFSFFIFVDRQLDDTALFCKLTRLLSVPPS